MKRGKLNKARAILGMIQYIDEYVRYSKYPDVNVYLIKLADDLKKKRVSRTTKKFIRYHMFFDDIIT